MPVLTLDHPLARHHLSCLRDRETTSPAFRQSAMCLTGLLACQATQDLALDQYTVQTPLAATRGYRVAPRMGLAPILRAGLSMVEPVLQLLPEAEVWHLGLYRDEHTARPVEYYSKLPPGRPVDVVLVLDPMLATGGSATAALATLETWGVSHIKVLSFIAAPEGLRAVEERFPAAQIHVAAVDERLDDRKFIVPGLGDAGDRLFNT